MINVLAFASRLLRAHRLPLIAATMSAFAGFLSAGAAHAEVLASGPDHYRLRHEAVAAASPDAVWRRLLRPQDWWNGAHTFSGDAANLSLDAAAGGLWTEEWDGGSVAHGRVLTVIDGEMLRLDAPFGPLQGRAVTVVWTITVAPAEDGARITFDEIATGGADSALNALAPAVDGVKAEAIARLAAMD